MIFVATSTIDWCNTYGLIVEEEECVKCGQMLLTDIPFATNGYRGLKSKTHACGPEYDHFILVPVNTEEIEWKKIK